MSNPLISIIVCTCNRVQMLKQTMESIFAQQYSPVEIVVVDDGSTDTTETLLANYGDRVRYYRQEQKGIASARTTGCRLASGEYIAFQDDDDLMPPERIIYLYEALCQYKDAVFSVGDWAVIDKNSSLTGKRSKLKNKANNEEPLLIEDGYKAVLWPLVSPLPHTTLFRKADGERIGWFDDVRFFYACSDTDFFVRLGELGPIVYVPQIVSLYRKGHTQIWGNRFLSEYSRFLLLEKHLMSIDIEKKDLKNRLQIRMLNTLKQIEFLKRKGTTAPDQVSRDYIDRGLSLLNITRRVAYRWYALVRLPLRRLILGSHYNRG